MNILDEIIDKKKLEIIEDKKKLSKYFKKFY